LFNKKTVEDLYAEVGEGLLNRNHIMDAIYPPENKPSVIKNTLAKLRKKTVRGKGQAMPIKGLIPGMALHFAGCCHPIPGDKIVGIVTTGKGITIHTTDCETLENFAEMPERWIDVAWDMGGTEGLHIGRVRAHISHETAALATLANVIAKDLGNISNLKILNRSSDFFELLIDIEVKDTNHLNAIIANLRSKEVVQSIERYNA
jgi:GTP pyrophosphokinase